MTDSIQKTDTKRKREKPVIGSWVAKDLLRCLRERREAEAKDSDGVCGRTTEDIEAWDDLIRASVKAWRTPPREILNLDSETTAALDEVCGLHDFGGWGRTDAAREHRRTFALRAIKAVCQAWVNAGAGERPRALAVTLQEQTEDEKAAELLAMKAALKGV